MLPVVRLRTCLLPALLLLAGSAFAQPDEVMIRAARDLGNQGIDLYDKHEVSLTLHVPYYPVAYILGICAFVECLVLLSGLITTIQEVGHE